jgi:hypothetical protein
MIPGAAMKRIISLVLVFFSLFQFAKIHAQPPTTPGAGMHLQIQDGRFVNRALLYPGPKDNLRADTPLTFLVENPILTRFNFEANLRNGVSLGVQAFTSGRSFDEYQRYLGTVGFWKWDSKNKGSVATRFGVLYSRSRIVLTDQYHPASIYPQEVTAPIFLVSGVHQVASYLRLFGTIYTNPAFWISELYSLTEVVNRKAPSERFSQRIYIKDYSWEPLNGYQVGLAISTPENSSFPLSVGIGIANDYVLELFAFLAVSID